MMHLEPCMLQIPLLGVNKHEESYDSPYDRRSEVYRQLAYEYAKEQTQQQKQQPIWTVPNLLTFLRLVLVPVVMALWYAQHELAQMLVAVLFVTASVTDWLDGYIARKVRGTSRRSSVLLFVQTQDCGGMLCWRFVVLLHVAVI
jgi:CDP-diacylglycerol--glycerol-3-phosphate 3-phosphatidyltransferase